MSLTTEDLEQIRAIFESTLTTRVESRLDKIEGRLEALENDIKEIYRMIAELQRSSTFSKEYPEKSLEEKILTVHAEVVAMAKQAGITRPQS